MPADKAEFTLEVMIGTDSAMTALYGDGLDAFLAEIVAQASGMFGKLRHANPGTGWHPDSVAHMQTLTLDAEPCLADFVARPVPADQVPEVPRAAQCRTRFDEPVCPLFGGPEDCEKLMCAVDEWNCNWDDSPPLDGTPCGEGLWCMDGECAPRPGEG